MARPLDNVYRTAVLNALDKRFVSTIKEVASELRASGDFRSYQSTRRILQSMAEEGSIQELPKRLENNEKVYAKVALSRYTTLWTFKGEMVPISDFISNTYSLPLHEFLNDSVATGIKRLMFEYLVACDPRLFEGVREVPNQDQMKKKLKYVLSFIQDLHRFIKLYLEADIHSPVAKKRILQELQTVCTDKQIEMIVRGTWNEAD